MTKLVAFVKLDFITIKPYLALKKLLVFIAIAIVMSMRTENSSACIGIFMAYSCIFVSYPFAVGEKNGIDTLYATLAISRGNIVKGRYVFALCLDGLAGVLAYLLSFVVCTVGNKGFNPYESLATLGVLCFVFILVQSIQLPLYFKLGYAKAKMFVYLPFVGLPLVAAAIGSIFNESVIMKFLTNLLESVAANVLLTIVICLAILAIEVYTSYLLSLKFYKKRDF